MADEPSKPPAPPPPAPAAPPKPAPPAPAAPPKPAPPAPAAPPKPAKAKPTSPPKRAPPKAGPKGNRRPKGKPKGKRPPPKKGKPGQPPIGRKGGRIRIKLGLRANKISEDTDSYTDQIGWTTSGSETILSDLKDIEEIEKKEPETITHHCTMCGSRMQIPRPKRERYKVICAHPECGHEDQIGF